MAELVSWSVSLWLAIRCLRLAARVRVPQLPLEANPLIIGICPVARARGHVYMSPTLKIYITVSARVRL